MAFGILKKVAKIAFSPVKLAVKASMLPVKAAASLLGGSSKGETDPGADPMAEPMQQEIGPDPGAIADISAPPGAVQTVVDEAGNEKQVALNPEASAERMEKALAEQRRRAVGGLLGNVMGGAAGLFAARQEKLKSRLG